MRNLAKPAPSQPDPFTDPVAYLAELGISAELIRFIPSQLTQAA